MHHRQLEANRGKQEIQNSADYFYSYNTIFSTTQCTEITLRREKLGTRVGTLVQRQSAKKSHKSDDWMDFPFSVLFLDENNPEAYLNKQTKNEKDVANLRRHCKTTQNKTKKNRTKIN